MLVQMRGQQGSRTAVAVEDRGGMQAPHSPAGMLAPLSSTPTPSTPAAMSAPLPQPTTPSSTPTLSTPAPHLALEDRDMQVSLPTHAQQHDAQQLPRLRLHGRHVAPHIACDRAEGEVWRQQQPFQASGLSYATISLISTPRPL